LIGLREHLTKEGLLKLVSLKASLNRGLSGKLKSEFSGVVPAERSKGFSSEFSEFKGLVPNPTFGGISELRRDINYMN
jgi:hypothetical protein